MRAVRDGLRPATRPRQAAVSRSECQRAVVACPSTRTGPRVTEIAPAAKRYARGDDAARRCSGHKPNRCSSRTLRTDYHGEPETVASRRAMTLSAPATQPTFLIDPFPLSQSLCAVVPKSPHWLVSHRTAFPSDASGAHDGGHGGVGAGDATGVEDPRRNERRPGPKRNRPQLPRNWHTGSPRHGQGLRTNRWRWPHRSRSPAVGRRTRTCACVAASVTPPPVGSLYLSGFPRTYANRFIPVRRQRVRRREPPTVVL